MSDRSGLQSSGAHTYARTRLLCIFFAADANFKAELDIVKATFIQQRICSLQGVEVWGIPVGAGDASNIVRNKLMEFKRDRDGVNELLIVIYGGHARVESSQMSQSQRVLVWGSKSSSQIVYWNPVQDRVLFPGDKDTLLILDCCHAGAAQRELFTACKDIIAACAWDKSTPEMGTMASFTSFLLRALVRFRDPFSVRDLVRTIKSLGPSQEPVHQELPSSCNHLITLNPFQDSTRLPVASPQGRMQARDVTVPSPPVRTQTRELGAKGIDIEFEIGWGPFHFKFRISFPSRSLSEKGAGSSALKVDNYLERTDQSPSNFPTGFSLRDSTFFRPGRIFKILWAKNSSSSSSPAYEERTMIVVTCGSDIAYATPYNAGQEGGRNGQAQALRQSGTPVQQVDPASTQNNGKIYGVKLNVPVRKLESLSENDFRIYMGAFRSKYASRHRKDSGTTITSAQPVLQTATSNAYQQRPQPTAGNTYQQRPAQELTTQQSANPSRQNIANSPYQTRQPSGAQSYLTELVRGSGGQLVGLAQTRAVQARGYGGYAYQAARGPTNSNGRAEADSESSDEDEDKESDDSD